MATTVLHVISSARGKDSYSRNLGAALIEQLKNQHEIETIIQRDLSKDTPPVFDKNLTEAFYQDAHSANEKTQELLRYANATFGEVRQAEILVLSTPMYNLGMSALLKAWIDQLVRFGVTYHYDENGRRQGKLNGKKVFLAIASGGKQSDWPDAYEFISAHVNAVFNAYVGTTEMQTFRVEGTAMPGFQADYRKILERL